MNLFVYRILFIALVVSVVFTSCNKEKEEDYFFKNLNGDEVELHYNETQCADPWSQFFIDKKESFEKTQNKAAMLEAFLDSKQIPVLDVEYVMADESDVVTCTECQCYTGAVFYVKVLRDSIIIKNLVDLGFIITE